MGHEDSDSSTVEGSMDRRLSAIESELSRLRADVDRVSPSDSESVDADADAEESDGFFMDLRSTQDDIVFPTPDEVELLKQFDASIEDTDVDVAERFIDDDRLPPSIGNLIGIGRRLPNVWNGAPRPDLLPPDFNPRLDAKAPKLKRLNLSHLQLNHFFPLYYLQRYPDVRRVTGVGNVEGAWDHYLNFGIKEGRSPSPFFEPRFYVKHHADLKRVYGTDYRGALSHWESHGISEGRQGSSMFHVRYYLNHHPDLVRAFGEKNYKAAFEHWKRHGNAEGRKTARSGSLRILYYLGTDTEVQRNRGQIHGLMGPVAAGQAGATFIPGAAAAGFFAAAGVLLTIYGIAQIVLENRNRAILKKLKKELHEKKLEVEREKFREMDRRNYEAERIEQHQRSGEIIA